MHVCARERQLIYDGGETEWGTWIPRDARAPAKGAKDAVTWRSYSTSRAWQLTALSSRVAQHARLVDCAARAAARANRRLSACAGLGVTFDCASLLVTEAEYDPDLSRAW